MTTKNMNAIAIIDQTHVEAIKKAVGGGTKEDRKVYDSFEAALSAFGAAATYVAEKDLGIPCLAAPQSAFFEPKRDKKGEVILDAEGNPEFTEDLLAGLVYAVSVVGARKRKADGTMEPNGVKAVVFWPMPTVDSIIAVGDKGVDWMRKVFEKEAAHVAFRGLRNAETTDEFEAAFDAIPVTADDVISTHVGAGGVDDEAFSTMWPAFREKFKTSQPKIAPHVPAKGEVIKAIRSKAYAEQEYPLLEQMNLFVYFGEKLILGAATWTDEKGESAPIDASAIQSWLDGREELKLGIKPQLDEAALADIKLDF